MPSDKQIEAAAKALVKEMEVNRSAFPDFRDLARAALTAAEQAKPAPDRLAGAVRVINPRHFDILAEAMAEVKATSDGLSDQPIADIVQGCIDEINALEPAEKAQEAQPVDIGQHVAYFDEGQFHWMSGIAPRNCELYTSPTTPRRT